MRPSEDRLRTLMIGGLDGDSSAYAALLRELAPLLRTFYRRRMQSAGDDIEDLVQDTLIAVHTRRATYDRERAVTAWLFAIARYKMIDQFRRRRLTCPVEGLEEILLVEGFENSSNARMDMDRLLGELPAKQAGAIHATKIEGLTVTEAATRTGLSESDIKISIHRGLKALTARVTGGGR